MKLDGGWLWRALLLSSFAVALAAADEMQSEADISDVDDSLGLDEDEMRVLMSEDEAIAKKEEAGSKKTPVADANVSFQVSTGSLEILHYGTIAQKCHLSILFLRSHTRLLSPLVRSTLQRLLMMVLWTGIANIQDPTENSAYIFEAPCGMLIKSSFVYVFNA